MENSFEEQKRLERARKKVESIKGFYKHFAIYLVINIIAILYKLFTLEPGEEFLSFNTFNMAIFWGLGVVFHAIGVFGSTVFLGSDWEERKIKELMEKENKTNKWE